MIKAEKLKTYDPKRFKAGYMSVKRNGVHAIFDPRLDKFYSRTPKEITGLNRLKNVLKLAPFPVVGELIIPDVDFETSSGLIRSSNETPEALFSIFNAVIPRVGFEGRYGSLWDFKNSHRLKSINTIKIEPMIAVNNMIDFNRFYEKSVEAGEEGICWISPDHIYQPGKRTWDWMKRVPMKSMEVQVMAVLAGTPGKKYENSMGRMLCSFVDAKGKTQEVGVGIFKGKTDEWRQDIYNRSAEVIGEPITIEFKDFSKYGIPTQPRFKGFRWDL